MTGSGLRRRTRSFILWTARLALVAYLVQIVAIDHWHSHPGQIVGVEGSSAHIVHCHGAGDCSDGSAAASSASVNVAQTPVPPAPTLIRTDTTSLAPLPVDLAVPYEPPRAA